MFDSAKCPESLPRAPGVGFKSKHFANILEDPGSVRWLEIHAENYMCEGGRPLAQLRKLRENFPISCHGVGLSIGGRQPLSKDHLERLRILNSWLKPAVFSEHLAWSTHDAHYYNDLLPLPYTETTLRVVCEHIDEVQETLGRQMLLENPSSYLEFEESDMPETEFIAEISSRTGCGLLLDINNVFISSTNLQRNDREYIESFPLELVQEIHLGGHERDADDNGTLLLIDDHGSEVVDPVWKLYEFVVKTAGRLPTLVEWDNNVPDWHVLEAEAKRAEMILTSGEVGTAN